MSRLSILFLALAAAAPTLAAAQGCVANPSPLSRAKSQHNSMRTDDDERSLTVRWRRGDCELRVDARGDFAVRADLRGFTAVDRGGYVDIEERDGDRERRVRVTSDGGRLVYRWSLDGREGFDVDRDSWLAGLLMALERRTAMFAKVRVPELVRQGGADAVLAETDRMESDYVRKVYYSSLLAATRLTEAQTERLLQQTGDNMRSDYERAEVLRTVAQQGGPMSDRVTRSAIAVAHRMSSDYEKRRALSAGLEWVSTPESRTALFSAASTMSSSYELAELLIAAQRRSLVDSVSSAAYFRAVDRLTSDYEHRRTLSSLLKARVESPVILAGVLRSSETIKSDFELASLLVEFARGQEIRGPLLEAYLKAARSISSDHEYRRVLQALLDRDKGA